MCTPSSSRPRDSGRTDSASSTSSQPSGSMLGVRKVVGSTNELRIAPEHKVGCSQVATAARLEGCDGPRRCQRVRGQLAQLDISAQRHWNLQRVGW
jgi:hypothetical protein